MRLFAKKSSKNNLRIKATPDESAAFRRSRTLMGSSASSVRSVSEHSGQLQSDRIKKQKLHRLRTMLLIALMLIFLIAGIVLYLIGQYTFRVSQISTTQSSVILPKQNKQAYQTAIFSYIQSRPSERFQFVLNDQQLTRYIQQIYPEIYAVKAQATAGNYQLTLRRPIAVWKLGDSQYFVDREGESFEQNYFPLPSLSINDTSGVNIGEGQTIISRNYLRFIGRVVGLVETKQIGQVQEVSIPQNATRQVDMKLRDKPYVIKMLSSRVAEHTVEDLQKVIGYIDSKPITPQYIDIRLSGKAYYK